MAVRHSLPRTAVLILSILALGSPRVASQSPTLATRRPEQTRRWQSLATRVVTQSLHVRPAERVLIEGPASSAPLIEALMVAVAEAGGFAEGEIASNAATQVELQSFPDSLFLLRGSPDARSRLIAERYDAIIGLEGRDADYRGFREGLPQARRTLWADSVPRLWAGYHQRARSLFIAIPGYGNALEAGRTYDDLLQTALRPLDADAAQMEATGRRLTDALGRARQITVISPDGSRFTTRAEGGAPYLETGAFPSDLSGSAGRTLELPAGIVALSLGSATSSGRLQTPEDQCVLPAHGLLLGVARGVPTVIRAAQDSACFASRLRSAGRVSYLSIGLNPGVTIDPTGAQVPPERGAGIVTVHFGSDESIGGHNGIEDSWSISIPRATVMADDAVVVKDGVIQLR